MDLNEIRVFVKVIQAGSFSGAARHLGIPNSTASAKVSALERRLGVTLLRRTTRRLHITEAGETYFRQCLLGLEEIGRAESEVSASQGEPRGTLRVTAPIDMGNVGLLEMISLFSKRCPEVTLELLFTDRFVDLVADGVDIAIRMGELSDSGLLAKRVGQSGWALFASPAYVKTAGLPTHPKDLRSHACLPFTPLGSERWELTNGKSTVTVPLRTQVIGNDLNLVKALALAGKGIALLPTFTCRTDAKAKRLVRVLPTWRANAHAVHLVYPKERFPTAKMRAFLDIAADVLSRTFAGGSDVPP